MSKLPGDIKKRKEAEEQATWTLDRDLVEKKLSAHVILYSDKLFRQVAVEWLAATDQVNNLVSFGLVAISITYILHFVADTSPSTPEISGNDRCCISCNKRRNNSGSKGNPSRAHTCVQGSPSQIKGST
jgi:hypothetical protein